MPTSYNEFDRKYHRAANRIKELEAENERLRAVTLPHCEDLERCAMLLEALGKPGTFAEAADAMRDAAKELREALAHTGEGGIK